MPPGGVINPPMHHNVAVEAGSEGRLACSFCGAKVVLVYGGLKVRVSISLIASLIC